jgi:hypothetical protein
VVEDLGITLQNQGGDHLLEAYTFLENALKIFEREMMLCILDLDGIHFDAQGYHNQIYSSRLLGDATAMFNGLADVAVAPEAFILPHSGVSMENCQYGYDVSQSNEYNSSSEHHECDEALAELERLLWQPAGIYMNMCIYMHIYIYIYVHGSHVEDRIFNTLSFVICLSKHHHPHHYPAVLVPEVKLPLSKDLVARRIDVSRVRFEMACILELCHQHEDALMTVKESLREFDILHTDCTGNVEYINENKQINSFIVLLQERLNSLEIIVEEMPSSVSEGSDLPQILSPGPSRVHLNSPLRSSPQGVAFEGTYMYTYTYIHLYMYTHICIHIYICIYLHIQLMHNIK